MPDIIFAPLTPLSDKYSRYKGPPNPRTERLVAGSQYAKGARRLTCDILVDRDVALTMRDGVRLYADVFRPVSDAPVPAIINWAPYGKGDTGYWTLDESEVFPNRFGIKRGAVSGLQSWEGNDPAYWCAHGYAIVQVDARGAFNSEGDVWFLSQGEGRDGADAIEELAALDWCSGKIGMAGNSWLAMSQWRIASERPPHLAAIAPWEGLCDPHRNSTLRGGIPALAFPSFIRSKMYGAGKVEDITAMAEREPLYNEYWADKTPPIARIDVPAYVVACYTNQAHTGGTFSAWNQLTSPKWLRIHNTQEWPDFYNPTYTDDLRRFFDATLRGVENGWEETPQVRMCVLDPGHKDIIDRPETSFPPQGVSSRTLFLDAGSKQLSPTLPSAETQTGYALQDKHPEVDFLHRFDADIEIAGTPLLTLWVSAQGHNDLDLFVYIQKLSASGKQLWHQTVDLGLPLGRLWMPKLFALGVKAMAPAFFGGPDGLLRVSRRGLDPDAPAHQPELLLDKERFIPEGDIVEAEIPFWPVAMRWHKGEQLRLKISGKHLLPGLLPDLPESPMQPGKTHTLHTGGQYPSKLVLPFNPG